MPHESDHPQTGTPPQSPAPAGRPIAPTTAPTRADFHDLLLRVFDSPDGAAVLAWLHAAAGTRKPCFLPAAGGVIDSHAAAVRDGRTGLVWEIEANLAAARAAARGESAKPKTRPSPRAGRQGA